MLKLIIVYDLSFHTVYNNKNVYKICEECLKKMLRVTQRHFFYIKDIEKISLILKSDKMNRKNMKKYYIELNLISEIIRMKNKEMLFVLF